MHSPSCFSFGFCPADCDLRVSGFSLSAGSVELFDNLFFITCGDEAVTELRSDCGGFSTASCDKDRWRFSGQREQLCVLDHEISPTIAFHTAFPQHANDVNRFFQFLLPDFRRRPLSSEDMFVKIFSGANSEKKPAWHHSRCSSCGLSDDCRMNAHCGACHPASQPERFGNCSDTANHTPHEWTLPLFSRPRMIVIRDESERESGFLRTFCEVHEIAWRMFLA